MDMTETVRATALPSIIRRVRHGNSGELGDRPAAGELQSRGLVFLAFPHRFWLFAAFALAGMLFPLGATFQAGSPWPRIPLAIYTAIVGFCGAVGCVRMVGSDATLDTWPAEWSAAWKLLSSVSIGVFVLGVLLSSLAGNILMSIRWRR